MTALARDLCYVSGVEIASLGYRTDVMLRVLEGSVVTDHPDYLTVRTPANPEFWWGNFLLLPARAAHGQAAPWLSLFSAEFPAAAHVALGLDITGDDGTDLAGFAAAGLEVQRDIVLTAQALREPPHPNRAASIRPLAGDGDWQQSATLQGLCDAEDGIDASQTFTGARNRARRRLAETAHAAWFGAFLDGELVSHLGVISRARPDRPLPGRRDPSRGPPPGTGRNAGVPRWPVRPRSSRRHDPGHRRRSRRRRRPRLPLSRIRRPRKPDQRAARPQPHLITGTAPGRVHRAAAQGQRAGTRRWTGP